MKLSQALAKLRMIQEQGSRDRQARIYGTSDGPCQADVHFGNTQLLKQAASSQAADPGAFGVWHSVDNVL